MELLKNLEGMSADEQMTAVVELQKAAMKQLEEQKQVSIGKSAEMVIQGLKKIKSDFEAKFDSLNYDIQAKVANLKDGEQGIQGPKGDQGDRGLDGANGRDGRDGKDGRDGLDGVDGVGVRDAKIDFDGSLVISLTDGREINCGEVVSVDVAKQIQKVTHNIQTGAGGDSQTVLDAIAAIQATIATYGTMATQNKTSVDIEGGTIDSTVIGGTTPAAGTFTTLTATGTTNLGGASGSSMFLVSPKSTNLGQFQSAGGTYTQEGYFGYTNNSSYAALRFNVTPNTGGAGFFFSTYGSPSNSGSTQFSINHTSSAVNNVQVTGAPTGNDSTISAQGSDANTGLIFLSKGSTGLTFRTRGGGTARNALVLVDNGSSSVNFLQIQSNLSTTAPSLSAQGSDTNIPLVIQPKGTGALQAQQTDSTATGGNARGANAVDWQTNRSTSARIASAQFSVVSGGNNNAAQGYSATASGGESSLASGAYSYVGGGSLNTASSTWSATVGGASNVSAGLYNFVGGGFTNAGTSGSAVTTQSATMNGTTAVTLSGSNASIKVGQYITGTSISGDTYVSAISGTSLTLSKVASGSSTSTLSFYTPHGVVVGGGNNQATGSYSFIGGGGDAGSSGNRNVASGDWSVVVGGRSNTASGQGSFVGGGGYYAGIVFANTASGAHSTIAGGLSNSTSGLGGFIGGGYANVANGNYSSIVGGARSITRGIDGYVTFGPHVNPISDSNGVSQTSILIVARQTTDATATVLTSNTSAASTTNQVILPNNSAYYFRGEVISGVTGGGNTKGWFIEGVIKRGANAASTALVGTPTVTSSYADAGASTWTIALTADTTNGGLAVTFTGQAGTTIRTVCRINTVEMTY